MYFLGITSIVLPFFTIRNVFLSLYKKIIEKDIFAKLEEVIYWLLENKI